MLYQGKYSPFDPDKIRTYPLKDRKNKVTVDDIILPEHIGKMEFTISSDTASKVEKLAGHILKERKEDKPVILFTGGHLIKNGLGKLAADLVERGVVTLVGGQGSTAIHDFELALIGETSEHVPEALEHGAFGMAYEFSYINSALEVGNKQKLGFGESLGRMIADEDFRKKVLALCGRDDSPQKFRFPGISLLRACYDRNIPFTIHAGIGTDVVDQHPSFNGEAKGGCSGRDFLIFVRHVTEFTRGGVLLNIGSAVTGPEVMLKAVSMAANVGKAPKSIVTADFDIRNYVPAERIDDSSPNYYMRDQKSIVSRIPNAFGGVGFYIQGYQQQTFPYLYKKILEKL